MQYGNLEKLAATAAGKTPFPHLVCADFIPADALAAVHRDFPDVPGAGSFPLPALSPGKAFGEMMEFLRGGEVAAVLAEKLDAPLDGRPTMATVRGFCRKTDGKIHLDSGGKLITVLLYLNRNWQEDNGGRLRLLNGGEDIEDYFLEIPPGDGVLLAFRCDNNAWHGHLPFAGERRAIQVNWVVSDAYRRREAARHLFSAKLKKLRAVFSPRKKERQNNGA